MDDENKQAIPTQICSIRIGFPVVSDEQAIEYKKKLTEALTDIPNVRIEFNLSTMPTKGNMVM